MYSLSAETVFAMESSSIKFGRGATEEVGYECRRLGIKKVLIITDKRVAGLPVLQNILNSLETENIDLKIYKNVKIEPTDSSFKDASKFALSDSATDNKSFVLSDKISSKFSILIQVNFRLS